MLKNFDQYFIGLLFYFSPSVIASTNNMMSIDRAIKNFVFPHFITKQTEIKPSLQSQQKGLRPAFNDSFTLSFLKS